MRVYHGEIRILSNYAKISTLWTVTFVMASSATTSEQLSSCERELSEANWDYSDMSDATTNGLILPSLSLQEVFNSHKAMQYSDPSFHDQCSSVLGLDIVELEELECSLPSFLCSNSQLAARSSTPVEDERSSSFFTLVKNILEGRTPDCNAVSFPLDDFLASCGAGKGLISSSCENVNDGKPVSPSNPSSVTMQCQHEESSSLSAVPHDYNKEGLISQSCSTASSNHEELVEDRCHEGGGFTAINYTGKHDCSDVQKLSCAREADGTVSSFSQDSNPCSHQLASKLGAARRVCGDDAWLPGEDEAGLRFSSDEKGGMTPCKSIIVDHDQYSTEAYAASMEQLPKPSIIAANYDYFYNTSSAANCNSILENNGALEIGEKPMFQLPSAKELMYRAAALRPIEVSTEGSAALNKPKRRNVKISKDPQSVAARHRRERISEKIRILQRLVPGGTKLDTASMLDEAVQYLKFLKAQVHAMGSMGGLSCKVFPIITHTGPAKASIRPSSTNLNLSANYAHADGFPCSRVPSLGSTQLQDSSTSAHTMLPILYNVM